MPEELPIWNAGGVEPPELLKTDGWQPGMKPSAQHINWLFNRIYKCLEEIQTGGGTEELEQELATLQQALATHMAEKAMVEIYHRNEINQSIPHSIGTDMVFNVKDTVGTNADFSELDVSGKIKFKKGGLYLYIVRAVFLSNPVGIRSLTLTYNGNGLSSDVLRASDIDVTDVSISQLIKVKANDLVGASFFQNSGSSLDVFGGATQTFLQLYRLGGED